MAEVLLCVTLPNIPKGRVPIRIRPGAANHLRIMPNSPWPADVGLLVAQHKSCRAESCKCCALALPSLSYQYRVIYS